MARMTKDYRPDEDGPKGRPLRNNPERLARMQARKERMQARGQTSLIKIKPIANKEVNPIYRNQGFM